MNKELVSSMSIILNRMLGRTVLMEGFLGLMQENCKACSAFPEHYPELKKELDAVLTTVEQLIMAFVSEEEKK